MNDLPSHLLSKLINHNYFDHNAIVTERHQNGGSPKFRNSIKGSDEHHQCSLLAQSGIAGIIILTIHVFIVIDKFNIIT